MGSRKESPHLEYGCSSGMGDEFGNETRLGEFDRHLDFRDDVANNKWEDNLAVQESEPHIKTNYVQTLHLGDHC